MTREQLDEEVGRLMETDHERVQDIFHALVDMITAGMLEGPISSFDVIRCIMRSPRYNKRIVDDAFYLAEQFEINPFED